MPNAEGFMPNTEVLGRMPKVTHAETECRMPKPNAEYGHMTSSAYAEEPLEDHSFGMFPKSQEIAQNWSGTIRDQF